MIAVRVATLALLGAVTLLAALAAPATAQRRDERRAQRRGNADAITAERLRALLTLIASDETAGRATPSCGLDTTARFIASHM